MPEKQLSCRFRHQSITTPLVPSFCLNQKVYSADRVVDEMTCALCDKRLEHAPAQSRQIQWSLLDLGAVERSPQRNCLIVLQPRDIAVCLESIAELPLDKVYFRAYTECQLVVPINDFIRQTHYDNYLIVADDVVVSCDAYNAVAALLECHELATGYCRLGQDSPFVNVTRAPLRLANEMYATFADYDFYHIDEVARFQSDVFLSWFGGWALTGMRRSIWLDFPFRVNSYTGVQSDFESSWLLSRSFVCHRAGYIEHLRPGVQQQCNVNVLVGRERPQTIFQEYSRG